MFCYRAVLFSELRKRDIFTTDPLVPPTMSPKKLADSVNLSAPAELLNRLKINASSSASYYLYWCSLTSALIFPHNTHNNPVDTSCTGTLHIQKHSGLYLLYAIPDHLHTIDTITNTSCTSVWLHNPP